MRGGTTRFPGGRIEWELGWEARAEQAAGAVEELAADIAARCGPGYTAEDAWIINNFPDKRAMAAVAVHDEAIRNEARNHTLGNIG